MLKIWGRANSSNVAKVMWLVAELGVPHERVDIGGPFGGTDTSTYRALNPNGRIPTIEDEGFVLWESNAIARYLAVKHATGSLWPTDLRARADADRWMDWASLEAVAVMEVLRSAYRAPSERRDPAVIAEATAKAAQVWSILDRVLANHPYVAGDELTMGDIALGPVAHRWQIAPVEKPPLPALAAWYERLKARPAFAQHIAARVQ